MKWGKHSAMDFKQKQIGCVTAEGVLNTFLILELEYALIKNDSALYDTWNVT